MTVKVGVGVIIANPQGQILLGNVVAATLPSGLFRVDT